MQGAADAVLQQRCCRALSRVHSYAMVLCKVLMHGAGKSAVAKFGPITDGGGHGAVEFPSND